MFTLTQTGTTTIKLLKNINIKTSKQLSKYSAIQPITQAKISRLVNKFKIKFSAALFLREQPIFHAKFPPPPPSREGKTTSKLDRGEKTSKKNTRQNTPQKTSDLR
jgi:hypothetical protein